MFLPVHLSYEPDPAARAHLEQRVLPDVALSYGPDLPVPARYEILVAGRPEPAWLEASPALRALVIPFAGLPTVTRERLRPYPHISVHNLHHNAAPTAEMAVALLLAAARWLLPADRTFRQHDWTARYAPAPSLLLAGKTALILGYGAVGQRVGAVCRALGMTVLGTRRTLAQAEDGIYPAAALPDLLPHAHVLIVTLPATDTTDGLIGAAELARLPRGAVVVNVGRAAVIDPRALYDALRSGHLHGAGLDVWYTYPEDDAARHHTPPAGDIPFHTLENVVMSPHRAGAGGNPDVETLRMAALAATLNAAARGEPLPHPVSLDAGY